MSSAITPFYGNVSRYYVVIFYGLFTVCFKFFALSNWLFFLGIFFSFECYIEQIVTLDIRWLLSVSIAAYVKCSVHCQWGNNKLSFLTLVIGSSAWHATHNGCHAISVTFVALFDSVLEHMTELVFAERHVQWIDVIWELNTFFSVRLNVPAHGIHTNNSFESQSFDCF